MTSIWSKWLRRIRRGSAETGPFDASRSSQGIGVEGELTDEFFDLVLGQRDRIDDTALTVPHRLLLQAARDQIAKDATRQAVVPRLPAVVPLLMKQIRNPDASTRDLVASIARDPTLAAAVLRTANSAWFNPYRKPVDSLERVVVTLGLDGLRLVLATSLLQPILVSEGEQVAQRLWEHARITAVCCHKLAPLYNTSRFHAYLAGLVHTVGAITLVNVAHALAKTYLDAPRADPHVLRQLLVENGPAASRAIARDWQLPIEITQALAAFEQPRINPTAPSLATALRIADSFARSWQCQRAGLIDSERAETLQAMLPLDPTTLSALRGELERVDGRNTAPATAAP